MANVVLEPINPTLEAITAGDYLNKAVHMHERKIKGETLHSKQKLDHPHPPSSSVTSKKWVSSIPPPQHPVRVLCVSIENVQ